MEEEFHLEAMGGRVCHQRMDHSKTLARVADLEVGRWATAVNGFHVLRPSVPLHAVLHSLPPNPLCLHSITQ